MSSLDHYVIFLYNIRPWLTAHVWDKLCGCIHFNVYSMRYYVYIHILDARPRWGGDKGRDLLVAYLSVVSSQKNEVFMAQRILEILHRQRKKPASDIRIFTKSLDFLLYWVLGWLHNLTSILAGYPSIQFYNFSNKDSFFHLANHMKRKIGWL
jgi:hypothetical protein